MGERRRARVAALRRRGERGPFAGGCIRGVCKCAREYLGLYVRLGVAVNRVHTIP